MYSAFIAVRQTCLRHRLLQAKALQQLLPPLTLCPSSHFFFFFSSPSVYLSLSIYLSVWVSVFFLLLCFHLAAVSVNCCRFWRILVIPGLSGLQERCLWKEVKFQRDGRNVFDASGMRRILWQLVEENKYVVLSECIYRQWVSYLPDCFHLVKYPTTVLKHRQKEFYLKSLAD